MPTKNELNYAKTQFLASLNYEIRTPLAGILGMLDLLLETHLTEDQREMAESSRICAESLLEVMNSALDYSALAAKQVSLERAEFSLHDFLHTMLDEYSKKAGGKGLRFVRNLATNLPEVVVGDAVRLKQAIGNLLENAIKFTHRGEIETSASAVVQDGQILMTLTVRDTGIGIAPDKVASIFESFRQLDTGLSRQYGGMGLGLAVTQELMKLMHAEMTVASEAGAGSVFSIRIPLAVPRQTMPELAVSNGEMRVLLVDDLPDAKLAAINALQGCNVQVDCVDDGRQAIEATRQVHYDLILMDSQHAGSDGWNALKQIRASGDYEQVPILSKPVRSNELVETVERFLPFPKSPARVLHAGPEFVSGAAG